MVFYVIWVLHINSNKYLLRLNYVPGTIWTGTPPCIPIKKLDGEDEQPFKGLKMVLQVEFSGNRFQDRVWGIRYS